jgi:hypothetical protein
MRPVDEKEIEELLGPRVDVKPIYKCQTLFESGGISFELYKEAARLIAFVADVLNEEAAAKKGFARNQAICVGLLVKIAKYMLAVTQLSTNDARGDVVLALNRIIFESAVSLEFLSCSTDDKYFDQFVDFSLGPEREVYDEIQANIAARKGKILPIERRLMRSIHGICAVSGVKIEDVQKKHRDWGMNVRERLKALGKEPLYSTTYRMPSHAVHGTWPDLLTNHLSYKHNSTGVVFQPETKWTRVGSRLLAPMAVLILEAVSSYVGRFLPDGRNREMLHERIADLYKRLLEADAADEALKVRLGKRTTKTATRRNPRT